MEHSVAEYLINALWQVPLLAAGAWCMVRVSKPGPGLQHCLWLAVLGLAVTLPLHGMSRVDTFPQHPVTMWIRRDAAPLAPGGRMEPQSAIRRSATSLLIVRLPSSWVAWLIRIYLGTVILALLRVAHAWRTAWLLALHARPVSTHETAIANFSRRFGVAPPPTRESAEVGSPMIVGAPPVLLLPESFAQFTAEEIGAALCHELAHIKRHDYLVNLACQLAAVPLVWHPALAMIQQRIRMTREMACDALAAGALHSEISYAKCLLSLACNLQAGRRWAAQSSSMGLGLLGKSTLEERIMQLTERTRMNAKERLGRVAAGVAMMSASLVLTATVHLAPALASTPQTESQPAPQPREAVIAPQASDPEKNKPVLPRRHIVHKEWGFTAAEKARLQQQVAAAVAMAHSDVFQQQMDEAQRQADDARRMLDSEDFQQQMREAQRQAADAKALMDSPEFREQMENARKQASQASAMMESPAFKRQMEEAKLQAAEAARQSDNAEFRQRMEDMQKEINEKMKDFHFEFETPGVHP